MVIEFYLHDLFLISISLYVFIVFMILANRPALYTEILSIFLSIYICPSFFLLLSFSFCSLTLILYKVYWMRKFWPQKLIGSANLYTLFFHFFTHSIIIRFSSSHNLQAQCHYFILQSHPLLLLYLIVMSKQYYTSTANVYTVI